ncbi:MAG TPA: amidohydrolase [Roseiflexaceae bacterium]|nr:amidohydrolase [Roseiflexaceae bacterium]
MDPQTVSELKALAQQEVDRIAAALIETSDWMADHPELGYQEHQAVGRLTALLQEFGAEVERGIAGLPTAFEARLWPPQPGPKVAIVAEYDALPDVGHGCGHNIIATAAAGAGIALSRLAGRLPGSALVIGTPAEESAVPNAGGKVPILDHGHFDGVDAAIMVHPLTEDSIADRSSLVAYGLDFAFHGRAAHAAANPHEGINALDALIVMFTSVGLLRQQVRPDARIHGIITYGGGAPNVIPPYTTARFRVRAADPAYAKELVGRVIGCAEAGARAAGARMEWREYAHPYLNMVPNQTVGGALRANLEALGRSVVQRTDDGGVGSTDFGNVSHRVPAAYAYLGICGREAGWHTREVAEATRSARGHAAIIAGAKLLAMTAIDILADEALRARAHREHQEAMRPIREAMARLGG